MLLAKIAFALVPVLAFLAALVLLDSFKLVRRQLIVHCIVMGAAAAVICYFLNIRADHLLDLSQASYSRYAAPVIEETLKAGFLIYLFRSKRIGFAVDAAIYGFAIGAGFALIENIYYLRALDSSSMLTWVVRGFGTAAMHGGTMCIFGIIGHTFSERWPNQTLLALLPALGTAVVIHSAFNHFILPPVLSTAVLLVVFPTIIAFAFYQSERATQHWLGTGLDSDMELLDLITSGKISDSHIGTYLENLRFRFPMEVVVDMLCYLRLHLELALQAKGLLLMRQAGLVTPPDPELAERFAELQHLERSIGPTGRLAMQPFLRTSRSDMWQIYMLATESAETPKEPRGKKLSAA